MLNLKLVPLYLIFVSCFALGAPDVQKDCRDLEEGEYVLISAHLKFPQMGACTHDADCSLRNGTPGFYCGVYVNAFGSRTFDTYHHNVAFRTLEAKFSSLGCQHIPPPCPFMGEPVCRTGVCKGKFSP